MIKTSRAQNQDFWWYMSVIIDEFVRLWFIHCKIDLASFYSSKIGRRIRIWTLEKLKLSRNCRIIENTIVYDVRRWYMMTFSLCRQYSRAPSDHAGANCSERFWKIRATKRLILINKTIFQKNSQNWLFAHVQPSGLTETAGTDYPWSIVDILLVRFTPCELLRLEICFLPFLGDRSGEAEINRARRASKWIWKKNSEELRLAL